MLLGDPQITNLPVMSLQNGARLGLAEAPIIDPRKLKIIAYHVTGRGISQSSVLHTDDIREVGEFGFIVNGADDVMTLDDSLIRLNEVVAFGFKLIGKLVYDDGQKKLGKVSRYIVDADSFFIQKIHVAQSVLKNITSSSLIINRSQIIEVSDQKIIVRSASLKHSLGLKEVINPFRGSEPSGA